MPPTRVALVTGGGRGIGRAISLGLGSDGYAVAVVYHNRPHEADETVKRLRTEGITAHAYRADVADHEQVRGLIAQVLESYERIDVLVNNAGTASQSTTEALSEAEWDRIIDVNLKGTFLCSQAAIPALRRQGSGRIINLSSIAGQTGGGIGPHYAAAKAGIIGLTRFMARELGPLGITVNAIAPSGIPTELLSSLGMTPSAERPIRRVGTPEDVAAAVRYLASDAASYVTGQVLSINGGSFIG